MPQATKESDAKTKPNSKSYFSHLSSPFIILGIILTAFGRTDIMLGSFMRNAISRASWRSCAHPNIIFQLFPFKHREQQLFCLCTLPLRMNALLLPHHILPLKPFYYFFRAIGFNKPILKHTFSIPSLHSATRINTTGLI